MVARVFWALLLGGSAFLVITYGGSLLANQTAAFRVGDEAVLGKSGMTTVLLTDDEQSFAAFANAADAKDEAGVQELILLGRARTFNAGTHVRIIGQSVVAGRRIMRVRLPETNPLLVPPSGWLPEEWVRPVSQSR